MRLTLAVVALLLLPSGCGGLPFLGGDDVDDDEIPFICGPEHKRLPCAAGVEQGVEYRFNLLTHCGIELAYLDGRYWVPERRVDPLSNWAAIEGGTIVLAEPGLAVFEADDGGGAHFVPALQSFRPRPCA